MSEPCGLADRDSFEDQIFSALEISEGALCDKEFEGCTFRTCKLAQARLSGARFLDCCFEDCDMTGVVPRGMKARGLRFVRCKLLGVQWADLAPFPQLGFEQCQLRYATFSALDLKLTPFRGCDCREATFLNVDLTETDFDGTDLTGARFEGCQLRKADFANASGAFLDPQHNRVKDARISMESAALLALSLGMRVQGAVQAETPSPRRSKGPRR